jgi:hypothetical protein
MLHAMQELYWLSEEQLAFHEGLSAPWYDLLRSFLLYHHHHHHHHHHHLTFNVIKGFGMTCERKNAHCTGKFISYLVWTNLRNKSLKNLIERRHYVGGNIKMVINKHDATV